MGFLADVPNPVDMDVPPSMDEPLVWIEGSGWTTAAKCWLVADERGSVIAVTDSAGDPVSGGINSYDEYGIPGAGNLGAFQYTGQAWLPELGLYYYKARIYSPTLGRFMQTDPIGYDSGMNLYAYVGGDPVNASDPSGMKIRYVCAGFEGSEHCGFRDDGIPDYHVRDYFVFDGSLGATPSQGGVISEIKQALCQIIPDARTATISGGLGGIGAIYGSGTALVNYNTGMISLYTTGGFQVGWNGGASAMTSMGAVYGLGSDNTGYSDDFTGANASIPLIPIGANGQTGGGVTEFALHTGVNLTPEFPSGGLTRSITSKPLNVGNILSSGSLIDNSIMIAKNLSCH